MPKSEAVAWTSHCSRHREIGCPEQIPRVQIRLWRACCPHLTELCMKGNPVSLLSKLLQKSHLSKLQQYLSRDSNSEAGLEPENKAGWAAVRKKCRTKSSVLLISELCQYQTSFCLWSFLEISTYLFLITAWLQGVRELYLDRIFFSHLPTPKPHEFVW